MLRNSLYGALEGKQQGTLTPAQGAELTHLERAYLQFFVMRLGDRIKDDTSPFTSVEHKRLMFQQ